MPAFGFLSNLVLCYAQWKSPVSDQCLLDYTRGMRITVKIEKLAAFLTQQ